MTYDRYLLRNFLHTFGVCFIAMFGLVAVIDLGLQIDRGAGVFYSGLMISASILAGLALLLVGVAFLVGRQAPVPPPTSYPPL